MEKPIPGRDVYSSGIVEDHAITVGLLILICLGFLCWICFMCKQGEGKEAWRCLSGCARRCLSRCAKNVLDDADHGGVEMDNASKLDEDYKPTLA